ncbi:MAG: phytanoyl-CoA dioxygenase family protein [Alphaproteobacteria bacterium]|nr:phytanoyl-CoA dioxygenase family protein [Alphaproteobacteria bacterium]
MSRGESLPADLVGPLRDSAALIADPSALRQRLAQDGYVFLRGALPETDVAAARAAVLAHLASVGEVAEPVAEARFSGTSRRKEAAPDLGAFWRAISEHPAVRRVSHGPALRAVAEAALDCPALGQDFIFLRAGVRGRATNLHYDYPFFAQTTERTLTCWVPLGDVAVEDGPLVVVEGSNRFADLIQGAKDYQGVHGPKTSLDISMQAFARTRSARLLTENYKAGDLVVLGMLTLHGALDNHSDRIRLSFDVRWQPAHEPRDMRYWGNPPPGMTGRSYGELNGAKPLTEDWHQR